MIHRERETIFFASFVVLVVEILILKKKDIGSKKLKSA